MKSDKTKQAIHFEYLVMTPFPFFRKQESPTWNGYFYKTQKWPLCCLWRKLQRQYLHIYKTECWCLMLLRIVITPQFSWLSSDTCKVFCWYFVISKLKLLGTKVWEFIRVDWMCWETKPNQTDLLTWKRFSRSRMECCCCPVFSRLT